MTSNDNESQAKKMSFNDLSSKKRGRNVGSHNYNKNLVSGHKWNQNSIPLLTNDMDLKIVGLGLTVTATYIKLCQRRFCLKFRKFEEKL